MSEPLRVFCVVCVCSVQDGYGVFGCGRPRGVFRADVHVLPSVLPGECDSVFICTYFHVRSHFLIVILIFRFSSLVLFSLLSLFTSLYVRQCVLCVFSPFYSFMSFYHVS